MRRGIKAALAVGLGIGLTGAAPPPPPGFKAPEWLHRPRAEDLISVWPRKALQEGSGGRATIHCKVSTAGALFDCTVVDEFPKGGGFGAAAITLTPQFQLKPATQDGAPVVYDGVTLPIDFAKPEPATATRRAGTGYFRQEGKLMLSDPDWRATATLAEVVAAYPEKAKAAGVGGRALVQCQLDGEARPIGCDTVFEEPKGQGFGPAARSLAKSFQGPAQLPDGGPIREGEVQIPFVFAPEMLDPAAPVKHPGWARLPDAEALAGAFPAKARAAGVVSGRVALLCTVGAKGSLEACSVQSEDPAGLGFGEAGMSLTGGFVVKPWTEEGRPTLGARVRIPMRYEDDQAPAAKP